MIVKAFQLLLGASIKDVHQSSCARVTREIHRMSKQGYIGLARIRSALKDLYVHCAQEHQYFKINCLFKQFKLVLH